MHPCRSTFSALSLLVSAVRNKVPTSLAPLNLVIIVSPICSNRHLHHYIWATFPVLVNALECVRRPDTDSAHIALLFQRLVSCDRAIRVSLPCVFGFTDPRRRVDSLNLICTLTATPDTPKNISVRNPVPCRNSLIPSHYSYKNTLQIPSGSCQVVIFSIEKSTTQQLPHSSCRVLFCKW